MSSILRLNDVYGGYTEANILHGLSLDVDKGEIVAIVGPNGAGKSTAMKAVFGLLNVRKGTVEYSGQDITGWDTDKIVSAGVCYVPQVNNVFRSMSIMENLEMGAFLRRGDLSAGFDRVFELFPDLAHRPHELAGNLSGGQRQMVAMGRALMLEPKLLLLDEPTAGLSPKYMHQIFSICVDVRQAGVSILIVEQHAKQALAFSDRGFVLVGGKERFRGSGASLLNNPEVLELFLGGG